MKNWIVIGAVTGAVGILLGAFGAHGLRERFGDEGLKFWQTGVHYHLINAMALVLYGLFVRDHASPRSAGWCFLIGTILFSGGLYALALGAPHWIAVAPPIGGSLLIAGWIWFAWEARRRAS